MSALTALIKNVESRYGVRYVGFYALSAERNNGHHVFYQPNPDVSRGHSHYMGVITRPGEGTFVFDAGEITRARFPACRYNGETIWSKFQNDFQASSNGAFIDGGLGNYRCNPTYPPNGWIEIVDGHEVFVRDLTLG